MNVGNNQIEIENNNYIEETKQLIQKVTEAEIQKKYVEELEEKNRTLQKLYQELKETQIRRLRSSIFPLSIIEKDYMYDAQHH